MNSQQQRGRIRTSQRIRPSIRDNSNALTNTSANWESVTIGASGSKTYNNDQIYVNMNPLLFGPEKRKPFISLNRAGKTSVLNNRLNLMNSKMSAALLSSDEPCSSQQLLLPTARVLKLMNTLIKHSRYLKSPDINNLVCLDCRYLPIVPITGQCGHTRCLRCVMKQKLCVCGVQAGEKLYVNTIAQEIIGRLWKHTKKPRKTSSPGATVAHTKNNALTGGALRYKGKREYRCSHWMDMANSTTHAMLQICKPMTAQMQYRRAQQLLLAGKHVAAVTHLTQVASSSKPVARFARFLLAQTISAMCNRQSESFVSRKLRQSLRDQSIHGWLSPSDLECVLCTGTFNNPVTTPCGHTYCRTCAARSLIYRKKCALCNFSLDNFILSETRNNEFISSLLISLGATPSDKETLVMPVFTCGVSFPGMPYPLFVSDPRVVNMIQLVLKSGSRKFGMLAFERGHPLADYGTVLEIRDCVMLEDNRCIISTVGVSRFRVLERFIRNRCDLARIQHLNDLILPDAEIGALPMLSIKIYYKVLKWLFKMDRNVRKSIYNTFGALPYNYVTDKMGLLLDGGPYWLWWVIAVLPLKTEVQILILANHSLRKRMLAVGRTLDAVSSELTALDRSDPQDSS